jgi:hypothetical protein
MLGLTSLICTLAFSLYIISISRAEISGNVSATSSESMVCISFLQEENTITVIKNPATAEKIKKTVFSFKEDEVFNGTGLLF